MKFQLSTERLILREFTPDDADFAYQLNSDPEVIRFTGDPPFTSPDEARDFMANYDHYKKYGYGRWLVELKDSGEAIGWCGLKNQMDELGIVDIGYRFLRTQWGKGYAFEAAKAALDWGFQKRDFDKITARIAIGNIRSEKLALALGMTFEKLEECDHLPAQWFTISRREWLNTSA